MVRVQIVVVLALGLLISSCGPQFGSNFCATALYDSPESFPECASPSFCGDAQCDLSQESYTSCPGDCPPPVCGDGVCDELEDLSCPDCEAVIVDHN